MTKRNKGSIIEKSEEKIMLDCIIVGSGVAGISSALTLQSNGKSFLLFGSKNLSEKIEKAEKIHNYPGLSDISGKEFCEAIKSQISDAEIEVKTEKVGGVYALNDKFIVTTQEGGTYESRTVILATGVETVRQIEGEKEFVGRGVSYCATCDGFLYKGKTIAVVCTTKKLEHEIKHLASFAGKVYLIPMYKGGEIEGDNIQKIIKMPKAIKGEKRVQSVVFDTPVTEEKRTEIAVDGVFMLREAVAPSVLVGGLEEKDGHIVVTRNMETNIKGCFACGDCTGRPYQYAKAVGEGNVCAHAVSEYLR